MIDERAPTLPHYGITKNRGRFIVRRDVGGWREPELVRKRNQPTRERFATRAEAETAVERNRREDEAAMLRLGLEVEER